MNIMHRNGIIHSLVLAIALCLSIWLVHPSAFATDAGTTSSNTDLGLTPLPGNPERKAILDALRDELKRLHGLEVVFVVEHLKVKDGWSWLHTLPQSPDGQQRYEDVSALLQLQDGAWKVVELPCTEVDDAECLGGADYFTGLMQRFADAPAEIFPR